MLSQSEAEAILDESGVGLHKQNLYLPAADWLNTPYPGNQQ